MSIQWRKWTMDSGGVQRDIWMRSGAPHHPDNDRSAGTPLTSRRRLHAMVGRWTAKTAEQKRKAQLLKGP